jgi:hypothetical protein
MAALRVYGWNGVAELFAAWSKTGFRPFGPACETITMFFKIVMANLITSECLIWV